METVTDFILGGSKSLQMVTAAIKLKTLAPWEKRHGKPTQHIKKQTLLCQYIQSYGFSISHV